jgi:MYXO-CTERM domain-containing protein
MMRTAIAPCLLVVLGALLLAPRPGRCESPVIEFEESNAPIARITSGPVARNWTWHCDDPSNEWPLTQRCQVYDLTDGTIGSGNEVLLVDDDCGTAASDPTTVVYSYQVSSPQPDRRYGYMARCTDSATPQPYSYFFGYFFYYDTTPPTVTLQATPPDPSTSATATFDFTCSDNSQGFDLGSGDARCFLYCTLERADTNQVLSSGACDDFQVTDSSTVAQHTFTSLISRRYRFRLRGQDEGGAQSTEVTYEWTVDLPLDAGVDGTADAAADAAADATADDAATDAAGTLDGGADGPAADGTFDGAGDAAADDAGPSHDGAVDAAAIDGPPGDGPAIQDSATGDGRPPSDAAGLADMGRPAPAGGGCGCGAAPGGDTSLLGLLGLLTLAAINRRRRRRRRG